MTETRREREKIADALERVADTDAVRVGNPLKGVYYRQIAEILRTSGDSPLEQFL